MRDCDIMEILYLGYFATPEVFRQIDDAGLDPSAARQNYEIAFINNLLSGEFIPEENLTVISYLPRNAEIRNCPDTDFYRGKKINYVWTSRVKTKEVIGAIHKIGKLIDDWIFQTTGKDRMILTYAANPILLSHFFRNKQNVKIVTICSEVPRYRNMTEGNPLINKIKKMIFSYYNNKMDGYIYMSKYMDEVCNPKGKPWIVVEGMTEIPERLSRDKKNDKNIIFYAGGLHIENGIEVLLEAVTKLNRSDVVLQLCGVGNAVDKIKAYEKKYEYIQYLGSQPNEKVRQLEANATFLINPRKPDLMLTKFSFPSKTFEYFSSGTPSILTKLDGIPDEFYQYCYVCEVDNPEKLAFDLTGILNTPQSERENMARNAYEFLKEQKSAKSQTKKIVDFLYGLGKCD